LILILVVVNILAQCGKRYSVFFSALSRLSGDLTT
jgi:hypothetical protein